MKHKFTLLVGGSLVLGSLLVGSTALAAGMGARAGMMGGRAPGVFGTVSTVTGTTLTLTSKGFGPNAVAKTYTVDASNATVVKNGATSTLSSVVAGDTVMVAGTVSGTNVTATTIRDGVMGRGGKPGVKGAWGHASSTQGATAATAALVQGNGQPVIGGNVTAINGSVLTVTNKSNVTYSVDATSAKIVKSGVSSTLASVSVGDSVVVQGGVSGTSVTATSVIDQGVAVVAQPNTTTTAPAHRGGGIFGAVGGFFQHLFGFF